jgi:hypothetical protein
MAIKTFCRISLLLIIYLLLAFNKSYSQNRPEKYANNLPIPVVHNSSGIYAGQYSFSKDNLYTKAQWKGQWIWLDSSQFPSYQRTHTWWINDKSDDAPYCALFRKQFNINHIFPKAVLFITGDVKFQVYINGFFAGEGPVNIGSDNSDTTAPAYWYYSSFDVHKWLKKGTNVIAVKVFSWGVEASDVTSSFGRLLCDIQNGGNIIAATDTTWKTNIDTCYSYESKYLQYDASKVLVGWNAIKFDDGKWHNAAIQHSATGTKLYQNNIPELINYPVQPLKISAGTLKENKAVSSNQFYTKHEKTSSYILDFGKNLAAYVSFSITANAGDSIEVLPYEKVGGKPVPSRQYLYLCKNGINNFRTPNFSPFRYLYVRLVANKSIKVQKFFAEFTSYPVQYNGSFTCSDDFYNKLWPIIRYTTQICMSNLYLDSPMHQEPIGCTGDYFIESMNNYYAFGDKWLTRQNLVQTAQMMEKNNYWMFHTSYSLLWVQMLKQYVLFTGDTGILQELLPHADKLMDRFKRYLNKDYLVTNPPSFMFMDWIIIKGYNAHHPPAMIGMGYLTALLYKAMTDIDEMRALVKPAIPGPSYTAIADSIKDSMNRLLWDKDKHLYKDGIPFITSVQPGEWLPADSNLTTYSPHVNTLAVLYGIALEEYRQKLMDYVITQKEYQLQPYFMSYVLGAEKELRKFDTGLELINRWHNGIDTSTFTLKENWQDKTDLGYAGDLSHAWGGSPLRYLSQNVLGISPGVPGFTNIAIHPYIGEKLSWAKGSVPVGEKGVVKVSWKKKAGGYYFEYTIPLNKTATFYIPEEYSKYNLIVDNKRYKTDSGTFTLAAGKHTISISFD